MHTNFNVKQAIIECLRNTGRNNIEAVIDYMEKNGYFTAQCFSHHRYRGGLADHAWQTYQIALNKEAKEQAKNPDKAPCEANSIAITTLLHDFCKCKGMRELGEGHHGKRSTDMLKELGLHLPVNEFLAIRFHMHRKKNIKHFLCKCYKDPQHWELHKLTHESDSKSAKFR